MPAPDTECFQIFLETLAKKYPRQLILLFVDGAGNHHSDELEVPANIMLHFLPPYSPELNPQENLWDEIRGKIFKNSALKSMDHVHTKLEEAALYIERNPALVRSITSFPYIVRSIYVEVVLELAHRHNSRTGLRLCKAHRRAGHRARTAAFAGR